MAVENLITEHINIWTSAVQAKSASGRGSGKNRELYGIKKLRELILELAVRGKLVPQDPSDEPASVLLERIAAKKAQLVKDKVIPKAKPLPTISPDDIPNDLPAGWGMVRLGEIVTKMGSGSTPRGGQKAYVDEGVIFLRSQNVWNEGVRLDDVAYITEDVHQKMNNTKVLPGDVLLNITGASLGRTTIFPSEFVEANVNQHVTIIRLTELAMNKFVHLGLMSPMVQKLVWGRQVGMAIEGLSKKVLEQFEFPIPPLNEQHSIVAKVDELMALCDQLEQQTEASIEAHQVLVETLLATLTNSKNAEELMESWQRISAHFDTLFTTEDSIDQLKQTILQLAVMGKLVPQNPADEPASVLLERIAKEKAQLVKEKKIKKQKPLPPITDDEKPFELPEGWCFSRLENLSELITKGSSPKWQGVSYTENPEDILFVTSENVGAFNLLLDNKKYVEKKFNEIEPRSILKKYDFLMNIVGASIGRTALYDIDDMANINQAVCLIRPFPQQVITGFFLLFFNSRTCVSYMYDKQVENARPNLSMANIAKFVIPVPPLEEQKRIVAKIAEFMEVCEQLETCIKDAQKTQLYLTDAIVEQVV